MSGIISRNGNDIITTFTGNDPQGDIGESNLAASLADIAINVKSKGALGDGVHDDTLAIQAAHDELPTRGGAILFPSGKYLITSSITISKPVKLIGVGSGDHTGGVSTANTGTSQYDPTSQSSVIFTTSPTIDVIIVNASGFSADDLAIVNLSPTTPTAGCGLHITRGDGCHISKVRTVGFWNNIQVDQSEYLTISDSMFIDPVNYGLFLQNLVVNDQGDQSVSGCAFSYSGAHSYTGATAIRWESGGGLKMNNTKINMGPRGGIGQFAYGVYLATANNVSTSVFVITGNSFENLSNTGFMVRPQTNSGQIAKMTVTGNEFAYCTNSAIDIEGSSTASQFNDLSIGSNTIYGSNYPIYLKNVGGAVILPNLIRSASGYGGVYLDAGCNGVSVGKQNFMSMPSSSPLIYNNSPTTFLDHTSKPNDIDWHDKRNIPSTTSTSAYSNMWKINMPVNGSGTLEISINALVQGKGQGSIRIVRLLSRGVSGASVITPVGTDTTSGFTFDVNFDTSNANGDILVQIRLNATTGGTDINGTATLDIRGDIQGLYRS